jgi:hypothetical protein
VLDWETGQLYWNCLRNAEGDEELALQKVRQKYFDVFQGNRSALFPGYDPLIPPVGGEPVAGYRSVSGTGPGTSGTTEFVLSRPEGLR